MPLPQDTYFEALASAIEAGTLSAAELDTLNCSTITPTEKQALLIYAAQAAGAASSTRPVPGGSWGSSPSLPVPQPAVFKNVTNDVIIPSSIEWKAEVIEGTGSYVNGDNSISIYEVAYQSKRSDGQAHPPISLTLIGSAKLRINYTPIT